MNGIQSLSGKLIPRFLLGMSLILSLTAFGGGKMASGKPFPGLWIYLDDGSFKNHFVPSGWMGDFAGLKMNTVPGEAHSGKSALRFIYRPTVANGWVGVYWQDPANNWGEKDGGFDLTGARRLTFWARGYRGGEVLREVKMGGIKGRYPDSTQIVTGPIVLTRAWKQYSMNLRGRDLSAISGGFCWVADTKSNPHGLTFYLDDIRVE
jgi:hypothetical protein